MRTRRVGSLPEAADRSLRPGPSQKVTARHSSKKLKCEKRRLVKSAIRKARVDGSGNSQVPFSKEPGKTRSEVNRCSADSPNLMMMLQNKGPKMNEEMQGDQTDLCEEPLAPSTNNCFPKADSEALFQPCTQSVFEEDDDEEEEEEKESCETGFSDDSEMEPEELRNHLVELDNTAFLNEDSNQPLPVDRFFGSVAFMQDLPAAPLTRATSSRREFRKLHFIAKDDEDDDENEEDAVI